jgi:UDP-glucose 4-epimerase
MKICLTGASSFTGFWIADTLAQQGHHVIATISGVKDDYTGVRAERIRRLQERVDCRFGTAFGTPRFHSLVQSERPNALGLHGAEVTNYRSIDFDALEATRRNTAGVRELFETLAQSDTWIVATGSVFEPFEGVGDPERRAFSPYGLSKHFSFELFRMEAQRVGLKLGKFVIPNPFGPLEEPRFTHYLVNEWASGRTPSVGTPDYIRDNIHVDLLAQAYASMLSELGTAGRTVWRPSGYIESQGQFARRFASEMSKRFNRELVVDLSVQTDFPEPRIRVNDMPAVCLSQEWSEAGAWDKVAAYYSPLLQSGSKPST